ncbi:hypothetical protein POVWA2_023140 [Plasmodium ovale wallikeri]|uniref:Uncharacterized protein n=1 Tax=Plasmodium ovale wallikeri TaxID=864142 RepID=A0A1A8YU70_PLAOA|nr:hypothetical protein POVWA1_023350 [Plasmodium ovale wallikeri]SBT35087.1 hypothetical protein POVWA2_023140 [Plasmodium ovale wallikeri]
MVPGKRPIQITKGVFFIVQNGTKKEKQSMGRDAANLLPMICLSASPYTPLPDTFCHFSTTSHLRRGSQRANWHYCYTSVSFPFCLLSYFAS